MLRSKDGKRGRSKEGRVTTSRIPGRPQRQKHERKRAAAAQPSEQYWMRCPRCGLGLIETLQRPVRIERCTACKAVWEEPQDVMRVSTWDTTGMFKPFGGKPKTEK